MAQNADDDLKPSQGVVAYLLDVPEGLLRLNLDDVDLASPKPRIWKERCNFTSCEFSKEALMESRLSEKQLADIGFALVTRLSALRKTAR